jgi:leader peptidase (prepilin peptidase)/N-methyltransferase
MLFNVLIGAAFLVLMIRISWLDWKHRVIPNQLVVMLFALSIFQLIDQSLQGESVWIHLLALLPGLIFIPAWIQGKIGAGDIKLLLACGLFLGWSGAFYMILLLLILMLFMAAYFLIRKHSLHIQFPLGPLICASATLIHFAKGLFSSIQIRGGIL